MINIYYRIFFSQELNEKLKSDSEESEKTLNNEIKKLIAEIEKLSVSVNIFKLNVLK